MFNHHEVNDIHTILTECIWGNSHIIIKSKPVFYPRFIQNGILLITDLLDNNFHFLTYRNFVDMYGPTNFLEYHAIINTIPRTWKNAIKLMNPNILEKSFSMPIDIINEKNQGYSYGL